MRCTGRPTDGSRDCCATAVCVLPTCLRACAAPGANTATRGPTATGSFYLPILVLRATMADGAPGHVPVAAVSRYVERVQFCVAIASVIAALLMRRAAVRGRRHTVLPHMHATGFGNFFCHFGAG